MNHKECDFCGVRPTFVTANGIAEDREIKNSHCRKSKYGTHRFSEV